jgi:hypothetical protein
MTDKSRSELKLAAQGNQQLPCATPGCTNKRAGAFSKLCQQCRYRRDMAGSVHAELPRSLAYKAYAKELKEVDRLFQALLDHPGLQAATKYISSWLYNSQVAPDGHNSRDKYRHWVPARVFVRRLADELVEPQEILLHVAAAWLYARRRPETYDGREAYIPVLGRAMLRCKPLNEKKFGRLSKREVTEAGTELFDALSGFLVRVEDACNRHQKIHQDLQETLRIPL